MLSIKPSRRQARRDVVSLPESGPSCGARWREPQENGEARLDALLRELAERRDDATPLPPELRDLRGAPLLRADLRGVMLSGVDLSGADLSEADLSDAVLMGASLSDATLYRARLDRAELARADLAGANLAGASCVRAGFGGAELSGACLTELEGEGASFTAADLSGVDLRAARLGAARFRGAILRGVDATRVDLRAADLEDARVDGATFNDADLRESKLLGIRGFESGSWLGTDLRDVNFVGAYLFRRFVNDQNYLAEFRGRGPLERAMYYVWWLTSDCGRSVLRWGACTAMICLAFGFAYNFVALDYGDHETWLSPYYFSVVTLTTLGYGDVLPGSVVAQFLCVAEVICGYVMLGGMLAIFSNKLARRAD